MSLVNTNDSITFRYGWTDAHREQAARQGWVLNCTIHSYINIYAIYVKWRSDHDKAREFVRKQFEAGDPLAELAYRVITQRAMELDNEQT